MGFPPLMVGTCGRYKRETEKFVQWLGSTARQTGSADEIFETGRRQGGRWNGKSRGGQNKKAKYYKLSVTSLCNLAAMVTK